jgi:hypothetical protein
MATLTTEKLKSEVFTRYGFLSPPAWQIRQESIEKDYEVYVLVDGKYTVDYYRKSSYIFTVNEKVQDVIIFEHTLKPESTRDIYRKSVQLEGQEHMVQHLKSCVVLDAEGREILPQRVPSAQSEEHPEEVLEEFKKTKPLKTPLSNGVDVLRSKIFKRPPEIAHIARETFEIVDHAIIYVPVYKARLKDLKTGQEKTIKISGVSGKLI